MAKDPGSRYASAEELADDVGRVLAGQPVVAREPSLVYLTRKAIVRHRAAFGVAAVGLSCSSPRWSARSGRRASPRRARACRAAFRDVRQLAEALIFRIHDEVETLAGATPARQMVIAEGLMFLDRLEAGAAEDPALRRELAQAYFRLAKCRAGLAGESGQS